MERKYYVIKLSNRPDGEVNQEMFTRSSLALCLNEYYSALAKAVVGTTFTSVTIMIVDNFGRVIKSQNQETQYVYPEATEE